MREKVKKRWCRLLTPMLILSLIAVFSLTGCGSSGGGDEGQSEDASMTIITGGAVEQIQGDFKDATAVVLQDGKIVYVGDDEGAKALDDGNAELADLTEEAAKQGIRVIVDVVVNHLGDTWDVTFEETKGVGIRHHHGGDIGSLYSD